MKIAFYIAKYGTFYDKLISFTTRSIYSHCEIVFEDNLPSISASASVRDGGVRFKRIRFDHHWHVYDLETDLKEENVIKWFNEHDGDTYDYIGAIGSLFSLDLSSKDKKFCSQACATVLRLNPITTPGKFFNKLKTLGVIKCNNK